MKPLILTSGFPVETAGITATDIIPDTTNFNNNLSSADDTVQKALDTLDSLTVGGFDDTYFINQILERELLIP